MTWQCVEFTLDQQVAHLILNRPAAMNTLQPVLWREMGEIVRTLQRNGGTRALVISSTGKHFTAGMALDVFSAGNGIALDERSAAARASIAPQLAALQELFSAIEQLRMPVIAAIQGGCIGGGVDLIAACDIRLASADAFFCIQEINIGMAADLGTLQRLPKLIPEGVVHELAYTGRRLPAARALALGLVNEVLPTHAEVVAAALQMAAEIATKPPVAIWASKQAIHYARDHSTADALQMMGWLQAGVWDNAAMSEAFAAKREGRAAVFADLHPLGTFEAAPYVLR